MRVQKNEQIIISIVCNNKVNNKNLQFCSLIILSKRLLTN